MLGELAGVRDVHLVQRDEPRPVGQHPAEHARCSGRARPRAPPRPTRGRGRGSNVAQSTTCTSTEHRSTCRRKSSPRPRPSEAPGISPGHVGDGEDLLPRGHHPELRDERRERVVGDLRTGRGQRRDQRRLPRRREPDQPDVGDRAQLEHEVAGLARLAEQREARRLACGRGERGVAQPATARPRPRRSACRDRRGRRGSPPPGSGRRCRPGRPAPGRPRSRRPGTRPAPACRCGPWRAGGGGSRAACARPGRRRARPSHHGPRCRRPGRRGA